MSSTSSQRMNEDDDDMDLSKWSSLIIKVGFPVVVAGLLTWFLIFTVNNQLSSIKDAVDSHSTESQELKNAVDGLKNSVDANTNASKAEQVRTNLILQQVCINGAAARDRLNCLK